MTSCYGYAQAVDQNQKEIIAALRKLGYSVLLLNRVGRGCPDLLVGRPGNPPANILLEVKRPGEKTSPVQKEWAENWRGLAPVVVRTLEESICAITRIVL